MHTDNEDFDIWDLLVEEPDDLQHIISMAAKDIERKSKDSSFPIDPLRYVGYKNKRTKGQMAELDDTAICEMYEKGFDLVEVGEQFDIPASTAHKIVHKAIDNKKNTVSINELFDMENENGCEAV